ncbi:PQQ-dependent sugar dehydrogenase [Luminiphilus sp.]|nr:PQQ-dependent sugar dehydrogenase [Luminiphilus sp.]
MKFFYVGLCTSLVALTSCGGGSEGTTSSARPVISTNDISVKENVVEPLDIRFGNSTTIAIAGADADSFQINGLNLRFKKAPDYELPLDRDANNTYEISVTASNKEHSVTETIEVDVQDEEEFHTGPYHPLSADEFDYRLHLRNADEEMTIEYLLTTEEKLWGLAVVDAGHVAYSSKQGRLTVMDLDSLEEFPFNISDHFSIETCGQGGVFGIEKIDLADAIRIFFSASEVGPNATSRLSLFSVDLDLKATPSFSNVQRVFSEQSVASCSHYGGAILVVEDSLYLSGGDRGRRDDIQREDINFGNSYRFKIEDDGSLKPHPTNTFSSNPYVFTRGHRNVQGMTLVPLTGDIVASEHGPQGGDELNILKSGTNYGWPLATYGEEYGGGKIGETSVDGYEDPLVYYLPSIAPRELIYVNSENNIGSLRNTIVLTSLKFGFVSVVSFDSSRPSFTYMELPGNRISGLSMSKDGDIYFVTNDSPSTLGRLTKK